jgi:hypothetical protein
MQKEFYLKNLRLELINFSAFLKAVLMFWDINMRLIVWGTVKGRSKSIFSIRRQFCILKNTGKVNALIV